MNSVLDFSGYFDSDDGFFHLVIPVVHFTNPGGATISNIAIQVRPVHSDPAQTQFETLADGLTPSTPGNLTEVRVAPTGVAFQWKLVFTAGGETFESNVVTINSLNAVTLGVSVAGNVVTLDWTADSDLGSPLHFEVLRSSDGGVVFNHIKTLPGTARTYTEQISDLDTVTYQYKVAAVLEVPQAEFELAQPVRVTSDAETAEVTGDVRGPNLTGAGA